jgi:hypothetical protein
VCTTIPRVEDPDDQGAIVERKDPGGATTEKLSTGDYVARNRLILLAVQWPEIKERITGETNRLLSMGMSFSDTLRLVNELVQKAEPEIRAVRAAREEQVRSGAVAPANDYERDLVARTRKTNELRAEADAAEVKAGIKKKAPKDSGGKCSPA